MLENDVDAIRREREMVAEDVRALQMRYDEMYFRNEAEMRQRIGEFRRSKSHYSGKALSKVL